MAVIVSCSKVHGRANGTHLGAGSQVNIQPVAAVIIAIVILVSIQVAFDVHSNNFALSLEACAGNGNNCSTLSNCSDHTVCIHSGHILVGGCPGQHAHFCGQVPGQCACQQSFLLAGSEDGLLLGHHDLADLGRFRQLIGAIQHQQANIFAVASHGNSGVGPIGRINGNQIVCSTPVGRPVVSPVDHTVSFAVGHGLCIAGINFRAVSVGNHNGLFLAIDHDHHFIGFVGQIDLIQVAGSLLDAIQLFAHKGHRPRHLILVIIFHDPLDITGQQVHGSQDVSLIGTVIVLYHGTTGKIHCAGGVIKSHVCNIHADIANQITAPNTGNHVHQVVAGIHSKHIAVHILCSGQCVVFVHIAVEHLGSSSLLIDGNPAKHGIVTLRTVNIDVMHLISVQSVQIHFRIIRTRLAPGQGIIGLVAAVVTDCNSELITQIGDIDLNGISAVAIVLHHTIIVITVQLGAAGVHGNHSSGVCICKGQGDIVAILIRAFHDAVHIQYGSSGVDVDGHLIKQHVSFSTLVVNRTADGQINHIAIFQIREIIQRIFTIVQAVDERHHLAIVGQVHGLGLLAHQEAVNNLAVLVSIDDAQILGVTHQRQIEFINLIQSAVAIGRKDIVLGGIDHVAVVIDLHAHIGVHTQNPTVAGQLGPQHVVIQVGLDAILLDFVIVTGPEALVVPETGIKQRSCIPTAIETQEGQAQGHFILVFQVNIAFDIVAAGEIGIDPFLISCSQLDGDRNLHGFTGGHGNSILAEGHSSIIQSLVLLSQEILTGICFIQHVVFSQQAGAQSIGLFRFGIVVNGEGEGELAIGIVLQFSLRTVAACHRQISLGGHSAQRVHQTGALLTGRSLHAAVLVHNGNGGAHHQCICQSADLCLSSIGEGFTQILQHQSSDTGHLRCCHGGTAHQAVLAVVIAGKHVAADTGNIRQQAQVRGNAPAGEGAHLTAMGIGTESIVRRSSQILLLSIGHQLTVSLRDQCNRNVGNIQNIAISILVGSAHTKSEDIFRLIIPDQHSHSACILSIEHLISEAQNTTGNNSDLALDQRIAFGIIVIAFLAQAVNNDVLQLSFAGQRVQRCIGIAIVNFHGVLIEHLGAVSQFKEVSCHQVVIHRAYCHSVGISSGRRHGSIIDMLGQLHIVAPVRTLRAGAFVTGSNIHNDISFGNTVVNIVDFRDLRHGEAGRATQGHIDHINTHDHAVFQCVQDVIHSSTAAGAKDLHDDDLCIRCHTDHRVALDLVGSGNTRNVGTMVTVGAVMQHIGVTLGIVKAEGNLCIVVQVSRSNAGLSLLCS